MPTFTSPYHIHVSKRYALLVLVTNFDKARKLYTLREDGHLHEHLYPNVFPWDISWEVLTCDHFNRTKKMKHWNIFNNIHSAGRIVLEQLKGCEWMRPISLEAIKNAEEALKSAQADNKLPYGRSFSIKCAPIILQVLQGARSIIENGGEVVFWYH